MPYRNIACKCTYRPVIVMVLSVIWFLLFFYISPCVSFSYLIRNYVNFWSRHYLKYMNWFLLDLLVTPSQITTVLQPVWNWFEKNELLVLHFKWNETKNIVCNLSWALNKNVYKISENQRHTKLQNVSMNLN